MPHHVFTRPALYERVWAEPVRTVAHSLGVSDVGLAKACRTAAIPVPPRGYWAKHQHNKPLPPRPRLPGRPGGRDQVVIAPARRAPLPCVTADAVISELGPIPIPATLRSAHPIVRGWLTRNEEHRLRARRHGWALAQVEDLTAPLADRRLRLTSALLKALEARGLVVGEDRAWLTVSHGDDRVEFRLYPRNLITQRPATVEERRGQQTRKFIQTSMPAGDLVLRIRDGAAVPDLYRELKTPLDGQLSAIVAGLEAGVAGRARRRCVQADLTQQWATARAAEQRAEAYRQAQTGLVERLTKQAERHGQVEAIRAFITAADGSPVADAADYAGWRAWALAQAEAMDPLPDGSAPFARLAPLAEWGGHDLA